MSQALIKNDFPAIFDEIMNRFGITNKKVAELLEVHQTTIARWRKEPGAKPEEKKHIDKFAKHYRLTSEEERELRLAAGFEGDARPSDEVVNVSTNVPREFQAVSSPVKVDMSPVFTSLTPVPDYNPFTIGGPVSGKHFFGRENILRPLFALWNAHPEMPIQNAVVSGEKRIGKTSLLKHIKALATVPDSALRVEQIQQRKLWLPNAASYNFIYVDFQDRRLQTQRGFLNYLLKEMNFSGMETFSLMSSSEPLNDFLEVVSDHLKKPTIIMLDEIGAALRNASQEFNFGFWESMRSLATTQFDPSRLGFLLASPEKLNRLQQLAEAETQVCSPFFNIFGLELELSAFSRTEAEFFIKTSTSNFENETLEMLLSSDLKPFILQKNCHRKYIPKD